jgi:membrane fusion protein, adhesin transport system
MLNISKHPIKDYVFLRDYVSGRRIFYKSYYRYFNRFSIVFLLILFVILFLPWTQSISGFGYVTTLKPSQRPQTLQSPIPGRVEAWFVREGDYVSKGDTILRVSEVKSTYFDNKLLERTQAQIAAKSQSVSAYQGKISTIENQVKALENEQQLKLQQGENKLLQSHLKVKTDSVNLEMTKTNQTIAKRQYERVLTLQSEGLKSSKDVEQMKLKFQASYAKQISQENKLAESRNAVLNSQLELGRIGTSYADKIAKSKSDFYSAQTSQFNTEVEVSKLETSYANYSRRSELQFVTAPQAGYINKVLKSGIGETFKEGESLLRIMPADYDMAVETYVKPIDLPLVHIGERVRVQFDGWPAIVFSGWESASYGTYGAKVVAIENYISTNGLYRVLLAPDTADHPWPKGVRVGSGAKTIALLNDVPIWFELWRQLNGFPPNFYTPQSNTNKTKK